MAATARSRSPARQDRARQDGPGHDGPLPRSIRHGPRITLTCRCGERTYVSYGERWTCPSCGLAWDTRRIPLEQYAALRRVQMRHRRIPLIVSLASLVCIVAFIVAGKPFGGLILVSFALTGWSMFARPFFKRRYRASLAELPSWEIEPE